MNDDARKGRNIILIVIAALMVPALALLAVSREDVKTGAGRLIVSVVMSFLLWRGYSWARSYLAFGLGLSAVLTALAGLLALLVGSWLAVLILLAPLYAWGAWLLWSSPKVEAYIEFREKQRNPDMSFDSGA